jgi:hypothetical protein
MISFVNQIRDNLCGPEVAVGRWLIIRDHLGQWFVGFLVGAKRLCAKHYLTYYHNSIKIGRKLNCVNQNW